jgi:hypothetical protein
MEDGRETLPVLVEGVWNPTTTLAYGIASTGFIPLVRDETNENNTTVDREQLNLHQVRATSPY